MERALRQQALKLPIDPHGIMLSIIFQQGHYFNNRNMLNCYVISIASNT